MSETTLHTQRLLLRPFEPGDAQAVFDLYSDPEVNRYLSDPVFTRLEQAQRLVANAGKGGNYAFAVVRKDSGRMIGTCGVGPEDGGPEWGFGYCLSPAHWGNGYASEALEAMIAFAYEQGARDFVSSFAVDNPASGRVMEKCGLRFDREDSFTKADGSATYRSKVYRLHMEE